MAKRSKFFCIAVEGATCDGRTLDANALHEMAETYAPATYTARVNMEHIRGFSAEPPFNAYGDVVALETRDVELQLGGKTEKKVGLFAQVDALDTLVELKNKGQKLFSSMREFFAQGGKPVEQASQQQLSQAGGDDNSGDPANDNLAAFADNFGKGFDKLAAAIEKQGSEFGARLDKLQGEHDTLKASIENTDAGAPRRTRATGNKTTDLSTFC